MLFPLLLQVFLIALNAIFACAEISVISTNEAKLNKLISDGNGNARILQKLIANPSKFLSTIQIAITLSGFLGSAFAADNFAEILVSKLTNIGLVTQDNIAIYDTISVVLITLILSYFTLVFGELIPKRIGMRKSESIALFLAKPLYIISIIFTPIIWFLTLSINCVLKIIGIDPYQSDGDEGEENIRLMAEMSSQKGLIDKEECKMIHNVFEFDDLIVEDFLTHRTEMDILWMEDDINQWENTIKQSFHQYYPICGKDADDVISILRTKDYFTLKEKTKDSIIKKATHPIYFVPNTIKADVLFSQMKETKNKFAVVLDEYGGVEGIVTINDIVEQIIGDFNEINNENNNKIEKIGENIWKISGLLNIKEFNLFFNTEFPEDKYDTVGGLVFTEYGNVPCDNTTFTIRIANFNVDVRKIKEHIIEEMIITFDNEEQSLPNV